MTEEERDDWFDERRQRIKFLAADIAYAVMMEANAAGMTPRSEGGRLLPDMLGRLLRMIEQFNDRARLIAAAPEMLAVCRMLVAAQSGDVGDVITAMDAAREVIRKVDGDA